MWNEDKIFIRKLITVWCPRCENDFSMHISQDEKIKCGHTWNHACYHFQNGCNCQKLLCVSIKEYIHEIGGIKKEARKLDDTTKI